MGSQKLGKRMAKLKIIFLSIVMCCSISAHAYDIDELVQVLIKKSETNSSFIYDDLIDDLKNAFL